MRLGPCLTATLAFAAAPLVGQSAGLWHYTATAPISFFRVTPLGTVVVATADRFEGLDPAAGTIIWARDDLKNLKLSNYAAIGQSPFATVRVGGRVELIDLATGATKWRMRSEEHTSELQSPCNLVCRLLLEKKKKQSQ